MQTFSSFAAIVEQLIIDNAAFDFDIPMLATAIVMHSSKYPEDQVKEQLQLLPAEVLAEITSMSNDYLQTRQYYLISSAGTVDMSERMARVSRLLSA